jgi:TatD DNase family protein
VKTEREARIQPRWIDFHCHLDLYPNHADLIEACDRDGVATLAVTTTPKAWPRNQEMAARSTHVRVALGLHPQLVAERASELADFERYLPQARYVGEIGLDAGPRFYKSMPQQERVFTRVLELCAEQGGKILTVHSIRTVPTVLELVERHLPEERGKVVLHWFTGTAAQARRAVALGCYFSINREMLVKPDHRKLVQSLPSDRLLTETDGPFVLIGERQVVPADVRETVSQLSALREVPQASMAEQLLKNLRTLVT